MQDPDQVRTGKLFRMTRFILVASSKGGTGKTITAINLATALTDFGRDVILVDGNISSPNVGIMLGIPSTPKSLYDVLEGTISFRESVYQHPSGIKVIPATISYRKSLEFDYENFSKIFDELKDSNECIIIDCKSGINKNFLNIIKKTPEVLIITNPDLVSVAESLRMIKIAHEKKLKIIGVVINKSGEFSKELNKENVEAMLGVKVIAEIPYDDMVNNSLNIKYPVVYAYPDASSTTAFKRLAAALIGERYDVPEKKKEDAIAYIKKVFKIKK